jgi:hypothetical protein
MLVLLDRIATATRIPALDGPVVQARPVEFGQQAWELRRIGDLNPGGCCHPTALAVRRHRPD